MSGIITEKEIKHIAVLARLYLDDEDIQRFKIELDNILSYFEELQELDTEDIMPTAHAIDIPLPKREDKVGESIRREDILNHAPLVKDGFFVVDKVF